MQLWNTATGVQTLTYLGQTQDLCSGNAPLTPPASGGYSNMYSPCVNVVAWSPDGKYIASGDGPGSGTQPSTVKVWRA